MVVSTPDTNPRFDSTGDRSKDELETLCCRMSRLGTPVTASFSFAHTCNLAIALNASSTHFDDPWVIEFGASVI